MQWNEIVCTVLLALGCIVSLTGSVGLVRMPDFYTRLHTAGKTDSLAQLLILVGLVFVTPDSADPTGGWLVRIKLLLVGMILLIAAPTATHAITKAAHLSGLRPWTRERPERGRDEDLEGLS
jgi:multicomponent Na+:H+ antiporter subunit G